MSAAKKIKAFTLSEVIVVMILTIVVAGIAFSVLNLVRGHMMQVQGNFYTQNEGLKLEQALLLDINRSTMITYDAPKKHLRFTSEIDTSNYYFDNDLVRRNMDSIPIKIEEVIPYFKGEVTTQPIIDAIKIIPNTELRSTHLFIYRLNDANIFMNEF